MLPLATNFVEPNPLIEIEGKIKFLSLPRIFPSINKTAFALLLKGLVSLSVGANSRTSFTANLLFLKFAFSPSSPGFFAKDAIEGYPMRISSRNSVWGVFKYNFLK